ncbi:MAG: hypothetical protein GQ582_09185 [Methyloprofundus sp.]|nr:hypothetical protein [Methyloprofundus sp.]
MFLRFNALPEKYYISAFIDHNRDGEYQANEEASFLHSRDGRIKEINVIAGATTQVNTLTISGKAPAIVGNYSTKKALSKIIQNTGAVVSLNDPLFVRDHYSMGMWAYPKRTESTDLLYHRKSKRITYRLDDKYVWNALE